MTSSPFFSLPEPTSLLKKSLALNTSTQAFLPINANEFISLPYLFITLGARYHTSFTLSCEFMPMMAPTHEWPLFFELQWQLVSFSCVVSFYHYFFVFILKNFKRQRHTERFSICWPTHQIPTTAVLTQTDPGVWNSSWVSYSGWQWPKYLNLPGCTLQETASEVEPKLSRVTPLPPLSGVLNMSFLRWRMLTLHFLSFH